jgi:hypothetical protein
MLRIEPQIAALASPLWIAVGSAALLVLIVCALAFRRPSKGFAAATARFLLIVLGAALCGSLTWAFFDGAALRERIAERSALEIRAGELTARSLTPGSPLACLDAVAGATVQAACQTAIFASPANVASAVSYVAVQLALLDDMIDYTKHGGNDIGSALLPLQHALEADPFGFLAHVLVVRDGCTSEKCPPLALLRDPSHVRTNIIAQTLEHYLDHYREAWAKSPDGSVADMADTGPAAVAEASVPGKRKGSVDIDFPTAASIPPISIMNPEPKAPAISEPARKRGAAAETDPVWTPAPAAPAAPAAAPAPTAPKAH